MSRWAVLLLLTLGCGGGESTGTNTGALVDAGFGTTPGGEAQAIVKGTCGSDARVAIGSFEPVTPVKASEATELKCSVKPSGGAFAIDVTATLGYGYVAVAGTVPTVTTKIGSYEATDCTLRFSGSQGVAAGRVWGTVSCAKAVKGDRSCAAEIEIRFENCEQ